MSTDCYRQARAQVTPHGRDLERRLLDEVNRKLRAANSEDMGGVALLHEALRLNRNLWMSFAVDLASPQNGYTDEMKASLLSLAAYVEANSAKAVHDETVRASLIEINGIIADGLAPQGSASGTRAA
ncbi:MAG: flagellar biosynthesis regulator FlaF [Parvularcula sp.]|jgi:flagellar protein FlaF|nr:flagellar biosynthesis regulator FlaF [Parvularcula sp.]